MNWKTNWKRPISKLACLATLTGCSVLIGCVTDSGIAPNSAPLTQPPLLHLTPQTPVQTTKGIYTPSTAEIWFSEREYRKLEAQYLDLIQALRNEQDRSRLGN